MGAKHRNVHVFHLLGACFGTCFGTKEIMEENPQQLGLRSMKENEHPRNLKENQTCTDTCTKHVPYMYHTLPKNTCTQ